MFNNEDELLDIRLELLGPVVDRFVIVWSTKTFTGKAKTHPFPWGSEAVSRSRAKIQLICLDRLEGKTAWQKEWFSRNALAKGMQGLDPDDLVMISDVDEIPRPSVLRSLLLSTDPGTKVLGLDYFNFKFNYHQVHGLHATWAGPVVCRFRNVTSPQQLRDDRWGFLQMPEKAIHDAGWHFSFLTESADVQDKLKSFSHQESAIQSRTSDVDRLIESREGFHDHIHPGSVWAVVGDEFLACPKLVEMIHRYPGLSLHLAPDETNTIKRRVKAAISRIHDIEREKVLRWCSLREIAAELVRRTVDRTRRRPLLRIGSEKNYD